MAQRRLFELEDLQKLDNPIPSVSVHGVLTSLSTSMKGPKGNFFDGMLSNGIGKTRFVGFASSHKRSLHEFCGKRESVLLDNCEVKRARRGDCMELQMKSDTKILKSPRNFTIPATEFTVEQAAKDIALVELQDLEQYQRVNVNVKIQTIGSIEYVRTGHKKQDLVISDSTDVARLTLWEKDTDAFTESQQSYRLENFMVREFNAKKYLVMPRSDYKIEAIPDIEAVESIGKDTPEPSCIYNARIVAVLSLEKSSYLS